MVANELRNVEEERRMARAVETASQGVWMKLESAVPRTLIWKRCCRKEDFFSLFCPGPILTILRYNLFLGIFFWFTVYVNSGKFTFLE